MFDWTSLAVWGVSTALYWLTYEKPKPPKPPKVDAPVAKDGVLIPVFWGTVTVKSPANVWFEKIRTSSNYFFMQDVICLGHVEIFFGMFVGDSLCPYGTDKIQEGLFDDGISLSFHPDSEYQPKFFGTPTHPLKYNTAVMSLPRTVLYQSTVNSNYYYNALGFPASMNWSYINEARGSFYIGLGVPTDPSLPYPDTDIIGRKMFPLSEYPNRDKIPHYDHIFHILGECLFNSSIPNRSYKLQRVNTNLIGEALPAWSKIYRYYEWVSTLDRPSDVVPYIETYNRCFSQTSINPMAVIKDILTSPLLNLKFPESIIDNDSYEYCAQKLFDENFGMNVELASATEANEDVIKEIMTYIEGFIDLDDDVESSTYGKLLFRLARKDYDVGTLDILDDNIIERLEDYTNDIEGVEIPNSIVVKFTNRFGSKASFSSWFQRGEYFGWDLEQSVTIRNDEDIARRGLFEEVINRPWVSDPNTAIEMGRRYLFLASAKVARFRITGHNSLKKYKCGDVVKVVHPRRGFQQVIMRVFNRSVSELSDGKITLSLIEDYAGIGYGTYSAGEINVPLPYIHNPNIYEPTLWEIMLEKDSTYEDESPLIKPIKFNPEQNNFGQVAYDIYRKSSTDPDFIVDEYVRSKRFSSPAYMELDFNISDYLTQNIPVDSVIHELPYTSVILIGDEIMKVVIDPESPSPDNLLLRRACYDSSLEYHSIGDKAFVLYNPDSLTINNDVRYFLKNEDGTWYAKILALGSGADNDIAQCEVFALDSTGTPRYQRPLNCTGVKVNGLLWEYNELNPINVSDTLDITISWSNKSRFLIGIGNSDGLKHIYCVSPDGNWLEENVETIIEALGSGDVVLRTFIVPYTGQAPSTANTQIIYPIMQFIPDFPSGLGKLRISTRRLDGMTYKYSRVNRIIFIKAIATDMLNPSAWFTSLRSHTDPAFTGVRYAHIQKNVFYPTWYGQAFYLMSTGSTSPNQEPNDPVSLSVFGVVTDGLSVANIPLQTLIDKNFKTKTRAFSGGLVRDLMTITQATMFMPPKIYIRYISIGEREIYVGSNTDYYSDWFDLNYDYKLYLAYEYSWVSAANPNEPDKGSNQYPEMPLWSNADMEQYLVPRYQPTIVSSVPQTARVLCISARAKAKIIRKSDLQEFWTRDFYIKSWQPNITPLNYHPYRTLKIFPQPIVTVVETYITSPLRYVYTITVTADPSASWYAENWEWRLASYATTGVTQPDIDIDPNNELIFTKGTDYTLVVSANRRLQWFVCAVDIICDRTLDAVYNNKARITSQSYAYWTRATIPIPTPIIYGFEEVYSGYLWMNISVENQYDFDRGFGVSFRYTYTTNVLPNFSAPIPPDPTIANAGFAVGSFIRVPWGSQAYPSTIYNIKVKIMAQVYTDAGQTTYTLSTIGYKSFTRSHQTPSN